MGRCCAYQASLWVCQRLVEAGRQEGADSRQIIINGVDVTDPNKTYSSQEWARLRGYYDFINQQRQRASGGLINGGRQPGRGAGRGRGGNAGEILPRSVQALQQAVLLV